MNVLLANEIENLTMARPDQQRQHDALHFRRTHVLQNQYGMAEHIVSQVRLPRVRKEGNSVSDGNEDGREAVEVITIRDASVAAD